MTQPAQSLPKLPTGRLLQEVRRALVREPSNDYPLGTAMALLEQNPGLARTDAQWYKDVQSDPIIFSAIRERKYDFVLECLKLGSSPLAVKTVRFADETALAEALQESLGDPRSIEVLQAMLAHPDTASLPLVDRDGRLILQHTRNMMKGADRQGGLGQKRRDIFRELVKRTPHELLAEKACLGECLVLNAASTGQVNTNNTIFMLRTLADYGADLDNISDSSPHPLTLMAKNDQPGAIAALLAAGIDEERKGPHRREELITVGDYLHDCLEDSFATRAEQECARILDYEIGRITIQLEMPEKVLFTPEGRPSWQAQGLVMRGRLGELFDPHHAPHFGGRQQQCEFALRLRDALPERQRKHYFDLTGVLRDSALAQPEDAVTVRYLRGEAPAAGKGAA